MILHKTLFFKKLTLVAKLPLSEQPYFGPEEYKYLVIGLFF